MGVGIYIYFIVDGVEVDCDRWQGVRDIFFIGDRGYRNSGNDVEVVWKRIC
jgi:hypothetical protein